MVKFVKVQIPPELFKPKWPNMRDVCVTHHRDSFMIEAMHDAVLTSMNGTQNLTTGENFNSWTSVFDSRELVTELMAPFNEHTQTHTHTS